MKRHWMLKPTYNFSSITAINPCSTESLVEQAVEKNDADRAGKIEQLEAQLNTMAGMFSRLIEIQGFTAFQVGELLGLDGELTEVAGRDFVEALIKWRREAEIHWAQKLSVAELRQRICKEHGMDYDDLYPVRSAEAERAVNRASRVRQKQRKTKS